MMRSDNSSTSSALFLPLKSNFRIDLLTLVICGPADTPFDTTPFLIDLWLPSNYPNEPPKASSNNSTINPNLQKKNR